MATPQPDAQAHRGKRLKLAVITSIISKLTTAIVVLVAIPVGRAALGEEAFAIYGPIISLLAFLRIANIGLGPAMTVRLAQAAAEDDEDRQSRLFASGMLPVVVIGLLAVIGALVGTSLLTPAQILGENALGLNQADLKTALLCMSVFAGLQLVMTAAEAAQIGYQETHRINLRQIVGNVFAFVSILLAAKYAPSITWLIVAVNAPMYAVQIGNMFLFLRGRPHLKISTKRFAKKEFKELASDGIAYALSGSLASYLGMQFPIALAYRSLEGDQVALNLFAFQLVTQAYGMISMVVLPLRPALVDAATRGDTAWVKRTYRKAILYALGVASVAGIGFITFGQPVIPTITNIEFTPSWLFLIAWAAHFLFFCWEHVHFSILFALGWRYQAAAVWLGRTLVAVAIIPMAFQKYGPAGAFLVMATAILVLSAGPMFLLVKKALKRLSDQASQAAAQA
jgi:O-antigen/teichoic acid export membrane protein